MASITTVLELSGLETPYVTELNVYTRTVNRYLCPAVSDPAGTTSTALYQSDTNGSKSQFDGGGNDVVLAMAHDHSKNSEFNVFRFSAALYRFRSGFSDLAALILKLRFVHCRRLEI